MQAPFAARPDDRIAIAVGRTRTNRQLRSAARDEADGAVIHAEYPVELNYSAALTPWLTLMPNLQRIRQTGPDARTLTVAGLRIEIAL